MTERGWVDFAKDMADAGASGIELNVYYIPTESIAPAREVEQQYVDVLAPSKAAVSIPVAMKVGPYFSSFANMAQQFDRAGADALVLFNRFYQPDFDIENRAVVPSIALSTPARDPVAAAVAVAPAWRASAPRSPPRPASTAPLRRIKYLMAGADVVMSTSRCCSRARRSSPDAGGHDGWMEQKGYPLSTSCEAA